MIKTDENKVPLRIHHGEALACGGYYGKFDVIYWGQKTNMHAVWDDKHANNLSYGGVLDLVAMIRKPSKRIETCKGHE